MRRLVSLLMPVLVAGACSSEPEDPRLTAAERCRAHYDILMRWITGHGRQPETEEEALAAAGIDAPDPWGSAYVVEVTSEGMRVWSWGPDKVEGTTDDICYPALR